MIKHASECPCQYRHLETWRPHTHGTNDTKPRMLPHTASPPFSANRQPSLTHIDTPPSLPHSQKRREFVKYARRQDADRVAVQSEIPGHETRGGSQPSHSPPAHARCVHQHAHACAPCTCAMHMHVCTVALSLSGYARTVHACVHVHVPLVMNTI